MFRYKVLVVDDDESVNCINVNDHLVFVLEANENGGVRFLDVSLFFYFFNKNFQKFRLLQQPTELWGVTATELLKIGTPLSRFCLLINSSK